MSYEFYEGGFHLKRFALLEGLIAKAEQGDDSELAETIAYWDTVLAPYAPPEIEARTEARLRAILDAAVERAFARVNLLDHYYGLVERGVERARWGAAWLWDYRISGTVPLFVAITHEAKTRALVDATLPRWS